MLSPFHYFEVTDNVDLSQVHWVAGNYDERELENLYVFEKVIAEKWVGYILSALEKHYSGTWGDYWNCIFLNKRHAEFMGQVFNKAGIPLDFLVVESESAVRDSVKRCLLMKEIALFYNALRESLTFPWGKTKTM